MPVAFEPDISEHASPAAVPVWKRVNRDRPVMKPHGLLQERIPLCLPEVEVVEKGLKLHRNLMPVTAESEVFLAEFTSPLPDLAEHLLVKPLCPEEGERCRAA